MSRAAGAKKGFSSCQPQNVRKAALKTPFLQRGALSLLFLVQSLGKARAQRDHLGLGVQQPAASWGSMLNNAQSYIGEASWLAMFPGILILLTVFSFNVLGDVFRTAFEPGANRDE